MPELYGCFTYFNPELRFKINLTKQAQKFLQLLPQKQERQLAMKLQELRFQPQSHDCQKLKGYPYFRTDIREYRIIYLYNDESLKIKLIDKRNDDLVYKKLKRLKETDH